MTKKMIRDMRTRTLTAARTGVNARQAGARTPELFLSRRVM